MRLNLLKLLKVTTQSLIQNKDFLLALGTGGSAIATVILAATGQHAADKEIEERNKQLAVNDEEPLTAREEVALSVRHHLGTAIGTGITLVFIWRGYTNGMRYKAQVVELTGSYALLSKSYDSLQKAIEDTGHTEEVKEKVLDNVYQEQKEDVREELRRAEAEHPHDGLSLFIEEVTGQRFWGTREDAKEAINKVNYEMNIANGYAEASMNDLLRELGLSPMGGGIGDRIGWDIMYTGIIDVRFYRPDAGDDNPNENVWVMGYINPPMENFGKSYGI